MVGVVVVVVVRGEGGSSLQNERMRQSVYPIPCIAYGMRPFRNSVIRNAEDWIAMSVFHAMSIFRASGSTWLAIAQNW